MAFSPPIKTHDAYQHPVSAQAGESATDCCISFVLTDEKEGAKREVEEKFGHVISFGKGRLCLVTFYVQEHCVLSTLTLL